MVRAILEGRKTQTRRIVKPQGAIITDGVARSLGVCPPVIKNAPAIPCPYGKPGDRLWVRETFHTSLIGEVGTSITYKAGPETTDDQPWHNFTSSVDAYEWTSHKYKKHWMPSIHMPRWASRITLEVESVRVEQLENLSESDAKAEGVERDDFPFNPWMNYAASIYQLGSARESYQSLWTEINGPGSWEANPWVWCISFGKL